MFESYTGKHADPESVARNKKRTRYIGAAASVAMAVTLNSSSQASEGAARPAPIASIFDVDCNSADRRKLLNEHEQQVVVVRLDCVDQERVSDHGAVVLRVIQEKNGLADASRVPDKSILEASCREDSISDFSAYDEGESSEWVRLVDRSGTASLDGMPIVDVFTHTSKYVNGAYVVGEQQLPECTLEA